MTIINKILPKHNLAIFAGRGNLPQILINHCLSKGQKFTLFLLNSEVYDIDYSSYSPYFVDYGEVEKFLSIMAKEQIKYLVFIGAVNKPNFRNLNVDKTAAILLAKILANKILGDDAVLRTVVKFFANYGFNILSIEDLIDCTVRKPTILTNIIPNKQQLNAINLGIKAIKHFSKFDIGQSLIISQQQIIAIEASEGTDEMIKRCKDLKIEYKNQAILIKMKKIGQSQKVDLPTIGIDTIKNCQQSSICGIAIQAKSTLIINKEEVVDFANRHNIFIKIF